MLKKFKNSFKQSLAQHVAGATVRHAGPFSDLPVIENKTAMDQATIDKFVVPLYMKNPATPEYVNAISEIKNEITPEIASELLGDFNWRTCSVGADFAAIYMYREFEENIGNLLLRSDVCYAGQNYCIALASFGTDKSVEFLNKYLEYYLKRTDLWFDQLSALSALSYLDDLRGEENSTRHETAWNQFVENKQNWDLDRGVIAFRETMEAVKALRPLVVD